MKMKWFTMFDDNMVFDTSTRKLDALKTLEKRWSNAFRDPFFWILVGVLIAVIYFIKLG